MLSTGRDATLKSAGASPEDTGQHANTWTCVTRITVKVCLVSHPMNLRGTLFSAGELCATFSSQLGALMLRQISLIVLGCVVLLSSGCCCGPWTPHRVRQSGMRLSNWLNKPICSHHRRRHKSDPSSCRCQGHGYGTCHHQGVACPPCGPLPTCSTVICEGECWPVCCEATSPCGNPCDSCDSPCGEDVERQSPAGPLPAAPPASPAPVPDPVPNGDQHVHIRLPDTVQQSGWVQEAEEATPSVTLPGQRVSHRELRAAPAGD